MVAHVDVGALRSLVVVAGLVLVALGSGGALGASSTEGELTGLWTGTDSDVSESESRTTTWEGEATIERRGDTYTLVYEIRKFSQNFDHDACSTTSITIGDGSATPDEYGNLVFVGNATTDITSDCKFYEASGGKAQEGGERTTVGYLQDGDVIRLDLLPASHIEMQPQMAGKAEDEWGIIVDEDGVLNLVPPPDGVLSISRSELPDWAAGQIVTVGAMVVHVGPPDVVLEGDNRVLIDGVPAARVGDPTGHGGLIVEGSSQILVNGVPAAVVGSYTTCPAVTGQVPHVGGPIAVPGTFDAYRLLTDPEYQEQARLEADIDYLLFESDLREKYGYGYGVNLYEVFRFERERGEMRAAKIEAFERLEAARQLTAHEARYLERVRSYADAANPWKDYSMWMLDRAVSAGSNVVEGDFEDVEIGDGIVIGGERSDVGVVADKGSLVLDRPLLHDHPAGAPLVVVPAELVAEARTRMAAGTPEVAVAVELDSEATDGSRRLVGIGLLVVALATAAGFVLLLRGHNPSRKRD